MKLRTLKYHIQEGIRGIFKNGLMSFASMAIVSACIFIVITSLCMAVNIDYMLEQIESNVGIKVMFGEEPSEADIAAIEQDIKSIPHVTDVQYYSKDDALDQAKTMFDSDSLESLRDDNPLPRSFDIKVDSISNQSSVVKALEKLQESFELTITGEAPPTEVETGTDEATEETTEVETEAEVVTNEEGYAIPAVIDDGITEETTMEIPQPVMGEVDYVYKGIEKISHLQNITDALVTINIFVRIFSLILILVLSVISVGIIMNTIKLTVFIRKTEINIMKYVGATDWFIRWPFVIEGIVIGLIGAIIPCVVCWLGYDGIIDIINNYRIVQQIAQLKSASDIFGIIVPIALMLGVLLGAIGSISSLEKHLNV
jgi:cell division transport system permease protein